MSVMDSFTEGFKMFFGKTENLFKTIERRVDFHIAAFQKKLMKTLFSLFFLLIGLTFIIVGIVLFLNRYFSMDVIILVAGLLLLYLGLMVRMLR